MSDSQGERGRAPTRRQFLKISGVAAAAAAAGAAGLPLFHFRRSARAAPTETGASRTTEKLGSWEDLYRQRWAWDSIAKGSHGWANCRSACAWDLYVRDGIVVREEQSARYQASEAGVPDFNPRGCQKGACYSERMYDAGRLRHPLKRAGERGEGKWKRISWDQALREIADRTIDELRSSGPAGIVWDFGTQNANGCNGLGLHRTGLVLDTPIFGMNAEIGDHHPGTVVTTGKEFGASSADDMFYSDLVDRKSVV